MSSPLQNERARFSPHDLKAPPRAALTGDLYPCIHRKLTVG